MRGDNTQLTTALEVAPVALVASELESTRIVAVNAAACDLFRLDRERLVDSTVRELTHPDFRPALAVNYSKTAKGRFAAVKQYLRGDGTALWAQLVARPWPADESIAVAAVVDLQEGRNLVDALAVTSQTDRLTGLARREILERHVGDPMWSAGVGAVIFIDLDDFKPINDRHGHLVGDEVLAEVGRRLNCTIGSKDLAARYGGDEFVVLLQSRSPSAAPERVLERIVVSIREPVTTSAGRLEVSATVGLATRRADESVWDAIDRADRTMLERKRSAPRHTRAWSQPLGYISAV